MACLHDGVLVHDCVGMVGALERGPYETSPPSAGEQLLRAENRLIRRGNDFAEDAVRRRPLDERLHAEGGDLRGAAGGAQLGRSSIVRNERWGSRKGEMQGPDVAVPGPSAAPGSEE